MLARDALLHRALKFIEELKPKRLCEFVVDGDWLRRLDRFQRYVEFRLLAGEIGGRICGGERDLHLPVLAHRHANELVLETRDELAGADIDAHVATGAALERGAVDLAGEVDHGAIALLNLGALAFRRIRLVLLGDVFQRLVDLGIGDLGREALERDGLEIAERDGRQHLEGQRIGKVGLPEITRSTSVSSFGIVTFGSCARRSPRSSTILALVSRIRASSVSAITERP